MKSHSRRRKIATLSKSLRCQLNSYALTASAAGVGMLALAQPADARIVYTPAKIIVPINTFLPLDLNHDGVNDLSFTIGAPGESSFLFAYNLQTNGVVGESQNYRFASALKPGAHIGGERKFLTGPKPDMLWGDYASSGGGGTLGRWKNAHDRYLGVKLSIKGKIHYGWVRLTVSRPSQVDAIITGYAYETIPNKPIIAGETEGTASQSDEAGSAYSASLGNTTQNAPQRPSLGMLALGAQSLSLWRRKKYLAAGL